MSLISYKRGQGSVILRVKIRNSSVSTGAGLTGLTFSSSGLIISTIADNEATATAYTAGGSTIETITTLGTYAAPTATKCRFKEVDSTNHKGVYEIQIADARFAVSSAKSLLVSISGATNAAECDAVIPLQDLDPYDAVRAGLTALPNVASGSAGAIITSGTGTAQLSVSSGLVTLAGVTHTGAVIPTVTTVTNQLTAAQIATGVWQDTTAGDFTVASSIGKALYINNVAPGGSGGLLISGSNSGTTTFGALTVTGATTLTGNVSMAAGLNITQSSSNTSALVITGNGTGHGIAATSGSGATGDGFRCTAASTNGNALNLVGVGTGAGLLATGGATGHGISGVGGATSGNGMRLAGTAGNSIAFNILGQGSAAGMSCTGGATGAGASFVGGATSGNAISTSVTSGNLYINANVTHYNGTAGTFASGRPEVNTTHIAGSAVSTSTAQIGVNVVNAGGTAWASGSLTSGVFASGAITAASIAADAIGASELAADAVAEIADQVWDEVLSGHLTAGSTGYALNAAGSAGDPWSTSLPGAYGAGTAGYIVGTNLNATVSSRMATFTLPTNFSALAITAGGIVQADLQTIKTQTVTCSGGVTIPAATLASTTNITSATGITVSTNSDKTGYSLTATTGLGNQTANITGSLSGSVGSIATGGITASSFAAGAIDAAAIAADAIGASELAADAVTEIVNGVWNEAQSSHTTAGSFGKYLDAQVSTVGGGTAASIADAVWDEVLSGHLTAGSTGYALNAAGSAGDPWSTSLPGSYTGTTAGFLVGTLRASALNILSPYVAEDNSLEIVIGDDYYAADNRSISFSYGANPSLSGGSVRLKIRLTEDDPAYTTSNTYTSTTGSVTGTTTQVVSFDIPSTTTDDLTEGWHDYNVEATLSNGHVVTLTRGRINALRQAG